MQVNLYFISQGVDEAGGAYVQAVSTCAGLRALGVEARLFFIDPLSYVPTDEELGANVFHFIGMYSASPRLIRYIKARSRGVVALSTIYWWTARVERIMRGGGILYYRYLWPRYVRRLFKRIIPSYQVVAEADLLLPNSPAEGQLVRLNFPTHRNSLVCPVPNGTDPMDGCGGTSPTMPQVPEHYVLCTGSFNIRKNQLGLVRALKNSDIHVVFTGKSSICGQGYWAEGANQWYVDQCRREAGDRAHFVGHIPHRSPEWYSLFSRASAFALASACETPSLAALEAALLAVPLAITSEGSAPEYFGSYAAYCTPLSLGSIHAAVLAALAKGRDLALQQHVKDRFLWSNTARITSLAYTAALARTSETLEAYHDAVVRLWFPHPSFA